jgi:hypothetical protein
MRLEEITHIAQKSAGPSFEDRGCGTGGEGGIALLAVLRDRREAFPFLLVQCMLSHC